MAMDASVLGPLMMANIDALTDEQKRDRSQVFQALASAIITHLHQAQINGAATGLANSGGPCVGVLVVGPGCIT